MLGKVAKTFFLGDVEITDSKTYLDNCVENYHRAVSNIVSAPMIIKVWEIVKGTCSCLKWGLIINRDCRIKYPKSERGTNSN